MEIIEKLIITNTDLPNNLLPRLLIRDNSVVSTLTGSSGKVTNRRKDGKNKPTIDKIENLSNDCGSPSQQILTIYGVLKYLILRAKSDHDDVVNIGKQ